MGTVNSIAQIYIDKIKADCEIQRPLVAIHCITYNHERFLRDALEGFVSQQTDFPYVAIVHEDKSTDGTAAILREYAEKYPDIIKPIFEEENQYSQPDGSLGAVMNAAINATGAKYVAYCEGDDYWTSPEKLQKQVDILETQPEYTLSCHNAIGRYENGTHEDIVIGLPTTGQIRISDGRVTENIPTASIVMRTEVLNSDFYRKIAYIKNAAFGDGQLILAADHYGKLWNFGEALSVYNKHNTGAVAAISHDPTNANLTVIQLGKLIGGDYEKACKQITIPRCVGTMLSRWDLFPKNITTAWKMFVYTPWPTIKHLTQGFGRYICNGFKFEK